MTLSTWLSIIDLHIPITELTHCGRVTHICVGKPTITGSDNGLSPGRREVIIWTNAVILLIGPVGTNFNEIFGEIQTFSFRKIRLKMSSAECCPFRLGLNVLRHTVPLILCLMGNHGLPHSCYTRCLYWPQACNSHVALVFFWSEVGRQVSEL